MAITTFNRYEKKYMISKDKYKEFMKDLQPYVNPDQHSSDSYYTICNIYYDTLEDEVIKKSISKPVFKEKLRLRCYGSSQEDDVVFLEIKKKLNGFVNKRRTFITIKEANQLIFKKVLPIRKEYHNTQVLNEIYYYVLNKELVPRISLSYDREAYFSKEDKSIRITFDRNITSRRHNVFMGRNDEDHDVLNQDLMIMEIKTSTSIPLWLTRILTKHRIFSNSFSKYGSDFYEHIIENRKDDESCLNPYLTSQVHLSH